jgi:hypothetical protein
MAAGVPKGTCLVTCRNAACMYSLGRSFRSCFFRQLNTPPLHAHGAAFRFAAEHLSEDVRAAGMVDCGAGTIVRLGPDGAIGAAEIEAALVATPGVDRALIHPRWVANHYRCGGRLSLALENALVRLISATRLSCPSQCILLRYRC